MLFCRWTLSDRNPIRKWNFFFFYSEDEVGNYTNYYDAIKQFSNEDGGYVIYKTENSHQILDSNGDFIFRASISDQLYNHFYSLVPYSYLEDKLYYYIIYFNTATQIAFKKYSFNLTDENYTNTIEYYYSNNILGNELNLITCQLMKYSNVKVISCFFLTHLNNEDYINCTAFNPEKDFKVVKTSIIKVEASSFYRLESEVLSDDERQKALIILSLSHDEKDCLFYVGYNINNNDFDNEYLIENNCSIFHGDNYYIGVSYFKQTEEFLVWSLRECTFNNKSQLNYLIYRFNNNFEYSFYGILSELILGDSCCKSEPFKIYGNSYHTIFFYTYYQRYAIIFNVNSAYIISYFILNKEISNQLISYNLNSESICENYSIYYNENCKSNMSLLEDFKILSERNYIEKCTEEIYYIENVFECDIPINCSAKYPYEMVYTHQCVEFCDDVALYYGICILNYNNTSITDMIIDIESYEVTNKQTDIISNDIEYINIKTHSIDTILATRNIESDRRINSDTNYLITYPTISSSDYQTINHIIPTTIPSSEYGTINHIIPTTIPSSDYQTINHIIPTTIPSSDYATINHIIPTTISPSDYQTINKLSNTIELEDIKNPLPEEKINELLNEIFNEKKKNNLNLIENLLSDPSINSTLDSIINGGKDYTLSNNETIIQLTTTENQRNSKNHNISTINLGECEDTLKRIYNINPNKSLLILKKDTFVVGSKIPIIEYQVYHPDNKSKLDLSFCNNKIEINIPVSIDENNLDKYQQDSDYYNDRCYSNVSDNGNDKPLESRRNEFISNNMSLCEPECDYMGYDFETKNSKCECKLKNEISIFSIKIDTELLYQKFTGLTSSNINIIKCYYLLFKKENYKYNIGFYIILFIIILFSIGAIIFIIKGYNLLFQKIDIITKINHQLRVRPIKIKNINKRKSKKIKKKKGKGKKIKSNNPPIKKLKNNNRNKKEKNNGFDLSNESKTIRKLSSKNNESIIKKINEEKRKVSRDFRRKSTKMTTIKK